MAGIALVEDFSPLTGMRTLNAMQRRAELFEIFLGLIHCLRFEQNLRVRADNAEAHQRGFRVVVRLIVDGGVGLACAAGCLGIVFEGDGGLAVRERLCEGGDAPF